MSLVSVCVLSGRSLCDGPIPRPEKSYRLWCVSECDQVKRNNLDTYCEQVGRRGKDYETKRIKAHRFIPYCIASSQKGSSSSRHIYIYIFT
jgi:hypothetical protein